MIWEGFGDFVCVFVCKHVVFQTQKSSVLQHCVSRWLPRHVRFFFVFFFCVLLFCVCPSVCLSVSTFFSASTAIICCKFVGFQHLDVSSRDLVSGTDCALLFFQSRLNVTTNQTLFQLIQLDLTTDEIIFQRMFQREFLISKVISYNFIIMFLKISERNVISF